MTQNSQFVKEKIHNRNNLTSTINNADSSLLFLFTSILLIRILCLQIDVYYLLPRIVLLSIAATARFSHFILISNRTHENLNRHPLADCRQTASEGDSPPSGVFLNQRVPVGESFH
jgi:hypothetical protein